MKLLVVSQERGEAMSGRKGKLTLSMIVRNEADRYLRQALEAHRDWIDEAVIIDDGSVDETPEICREVLKGIPLHLYINDRSQFSNEVALRKQQWEKTVQTSPEWILNLDADEIFEKRFGEQIDVLVDHCEQDAVYFRLYDMWSDTHYREDQFWSAHLLYRPFMVRYRADIPYHWRELPQHCGRFPQTINHFAYLCHPARIKHYGWAKAADRQAKYKRYQELDPEARYGWKEQYESILDEHPHLIPWEEA